MRRIDHPAMVAIETASFDWIRPLAYGLAPAGMETPPVEFYRRHLDIELFTEMPLQR
jgi:hypothetical protein